MGNYFQHLYKWVINTHEAEVLPQHAVQDGWLRRNCLRCASRMGKRRHTKLFTQLVAQGKIELKLSIFPYITSSFQVYLRPLRNQIP